MNIDEVNSLIKLKKDVHYLASLYKLVQDAQCDCLGILKAFEF